MIKQGKRICRSRSAPRSNFPPRVCFAGSRNQKYQQPGNALPVKFARAIAEHLLAHMAKQGAVGRAA
jgi:site-specific DNA-cytosine methylase